MPEAEKRTASISVRVSPNLNKRLERDVKLHSAKSKSELVHALIEEALAARDAASKPPEETSEAGTVGKKLDEMLRALDASETKVGSILERHEAEWKGIAQELRNLRGVVALMLINVLIDIAKVDKEKARAAVFAALTPKPSE